MICRVRRGLLELEAELLTRKILLGKIWDKKILKAGKILDVCVKQPNGQKKSCESVLQGNAPKIHQIWRIRKFQKLKFKKFNKQTPIAKGDIFILKYQFVFLKR